MAPELAKLVRRVNFLMLALAAVAVEIAARDGRAVLQSVGFASIWVAIAALVARLMPAPANPRAKPPLWVLLLLFAAAAAPFAVEPLRRNWTGDGYPLELQMVCGLRNFGLGLAACAGWLLCLRLACVVSLFLMLFAAAMTNHPAVMVVLGLYTAVGSMWLMLVYWQGLNSVFVSSDKTVAVEVVAGGERVPWLGLSLLIVLLGTAVSVAVIGPRRAVFALGELLPTSGGTGEMDPFARYGIGDGPEETTGDNARAAGMVESDKMIEDNKNSLIDAVNDLYGPPHKPPKEQEKMVAAGKVDVIEFHGKLPDNRRPSRDFDTSRKGPKGDRKPESRSVRGVLEIEGRTPLHIRVAAYDRYDPVARCWIEARRPGYRLIEPEGRDWMRISHFQDFDWYALDERQKLKVADLKSNLVPLPAMTTRFRINKVDRPEYYDWEFEGVLTLAGRKRTPPGVVVTSDCRTVDPRRLPESAFVSAGFPGGASPTMEEVPDSIRPEITRIANDWIGNRPRGWSQIEAILTRFRTEYVHDLNASPAADHPAPVLWFLNESRRGPDYLFSTACAFLVRSLNYPARICLGYYAAPEVFDPETGHTPVKVSDLHVWPEILLRDGQWLVVEPTPGYETLGPNFPWSERILNALATFASWAGRHAVGLGVGFVVFVVAWIRRRELLDAFAVRLWRWFPGRTWRDQVRRAVRVLELRGRWTGRPRPASQTTPTWLCDVQPKAAECKADFVRLTRMAEWAAYAPDVAPPWDATEVQIVCRRVLDGWSLRRWRSAVPESAMGI